MAKISPISTKYNIHAKITVEGSVDRPDVIGAIFGQTEGLLGSDLELRELQRSGKIGRIEVDLESKFGKATGVIILPSSLDKAETAIVGAALEVIQRIGPCNSEIKVQKIEDVRITKRQAVVTRAKDILKNLIESHMPDSQELADEVAQSVRVMELTNYGPEKLDCGPGVLDSDEIIIVEGRADVINLLKHGFKNAISMNGSSVPKSLIELSSQKEVTVFCDGDRGGDLNIKTLIQLCDIDFLVKASDGKEVEELTKKELHKSLRGKLAVEAWLNEYGNSTWSVKTKEAPRSSYNQRKPILQRNNNVHQRSPIVKNTAFNQFSRSSPNTNTNVKKTTKTVAVKKTISSSASPVQASKSKEVSKMDLTDGQKSKFKKYLEDLIGSRAAILLDKSLKEVKRVPFLELPNALKSFSSSAEIAIFDGGVNAQLIKLAEKNGMKKLVCMSSKLKSTDSVQIITSENL
ncbi:DNA primase [Candidatus Woesearchaeota archaeon]|jgi:DNA primase|nr:DNA primase [Candidatus Woesearchaeota archaeon]MBT4387808.1 DNA primase [Candidatus Woesearchaeota archaeon]MBT4595627.1 DNA primase [Candidatus Woesearchaeota archaeon]MBT5740890.1 DNA primase [Candidatus Woesearchaeota archaeon]MBT6505187.1 DNA primase [Candidatus Woesearchaeota archaeon]